MSDIKFKIGLDGSEAKKGLDKFNRQVDKTEQNVDSSFKNSGISAGKFGAAAGAAMVGVELAARALGGAVRGIVGAFGDAVSAAAGIETMRTQFATLTGSVAEADQHIRDLQKFAASTPFQLNSLASSSRVLQSFGFEGEDVLKILKNLGDVAAGSGNDIGTLATIFGQVSAAGKLTGERLLQLQERGVPVLAALADHFDTTEAAVQKMVTAGKVSFNDFSSAMNTLNQDGGKFFNGMVTLSETFSGKLSTLGDNFELLQSEAGAALLPISKNMVDLALKVLPALTHNIATFLGSANPGLQSLVGLTQILVGEFIGTGKATNEAASAGQAFGDVVLFLSKSVLFAKTSLVAFWDTLKTGTSAALLPAVAAIKSLLETLVQLPGVGDKVAPALAMVSGIYADLSDNVGGYTFRLQDNATKLWEQVDVLERQNAQAKLNASNMKALTELEAELAAERQKGTEANQARIDALKTEKTALTEALELGKQNIEQMGSQASAITELNQTESDAHEQKLERTAVQKEEQQIAFDLTEELRNSAAENDRLRTEEKLLREEFSKNKQFELLKQGLGEREAAKRVAEAERLAREGKVNEARLKLQESFNESELAAAKAKAEADKAREDQALKEQQDRLKAEAKAKEDAAKERARLEQGSLSIFKQIKTKEQAFEKATQQEKAQIVSGGLETISGLMKTESGAAFEVGKAAAIANATIQAYTAATGAYAAMASIPYVGPALGAAAAAAALTTGFANIRAIQSQQPAFETGGIVPGNNLTGDKVQARVNSGEMILTRSQQQNLFSQINSGNISGGGTEGFQMLSARIDTLSNAIMNQPVSVSVDSQEIARATRDGRQAGFQ